MSVHRVTYKVAKSLIGRVNRLRTDDNIDPTLRTYLHAQDSCPALGATDSVGFSSSSVGVVGDGESVLLMVDAREVTG